MDEESGSFLDRRNKTTDNSILILYRIKGILDYEFFVVHVKNSGLYLWNETLGIKNKIECNEAEDKDCEIDNIKASPNGQFLVIGFPKINGVTFFKIYKDECTAHPIEPNIRVSHYFLKLISSFFFSIYLCFLLIKFFYL